MSGFIIKAKNASGRHRHKCYVYETRGGGETTDDVWEADGYDDEASAEAAAASLKPWADAAGLVLWVEPGAEDNAETSDADDEDEDAYLDEEGVYLICATNADGSSRRDCYVTFAGDAFSTSATPYEEYAFTTRRYASARMATMASWAAERGLILRVEEFIG